MIASKLIDELRLNVHLHPVVPSGPTCCRCNKLVERRAMYDLPDGNIQIKFRCHGAVELLTIERADLKNCLDVRDALELLPKRVFWPGYSRYATTTKPIRRPV